MAEGLNECPTGLKMQLLLSYMYDRGWRHAGVEVEVEAVRGRRWRLANDAMSAA
jgi:hypothetical protein